MGRFDVSHEGATRFLRARFGSRVSDIALLPLQGVWSKAYAFRHDGGEYVVRIGESRESFDKDAVAARFSSPALPIPRIVEVGAAFDGYYAISERASGVDLDSLDGREMSRTLPSVLRTLDGLREADVSGTSGYGLWDASGSGENASWKDALLRVTPAGSRVGEWRAALVGSHATVVFDAAFARMTELLAFCPEERHLVHADLLHHNVLVADGAVTAVLDWGCAMYGDFLFDLAWFTFWAAWYPAWREIDFKEEAGAYYASRRLAVDHLEERLGCYELNIGLSHVPWYASRGDPANLERTLDRLADLVRDDASP